MQEQLKRQALDGWCSIGWLPSTSGHGLPRQRCPGDRPGAQHAGLSGGWSVSKPAYDATLASQGSTRQPSSRNSNRCWPFASCRRSCRQLFFHARRVPPADRAGQERRDVAYVLFDAREMGAAINVSDADVQSYYAANASQFLSAESANLEYLEVALTGLAQDYMPDEDALRKAYEADPTRFRSAEERRARHILIAVDANRTDAAARALADEIAGKLAKAETLPRSRPSTPAMPARRAGRRPGLCSPGKLCRAVRKGAVCPQAGRNLSPGKD